MFINLPFIAGQRLPKKRLIFLYMGFYQFFTHDPAACVPIYKGPIDAVCSESLVSGLMETD
ncbi:MAG TPA: hypothetical protein VGN44_04565 [Candidatus Angelobacter sp.]|jgi:hypothetical protein